MLTENGERRGIIPPFRYLMAIMGSIGLAIIYGFKVNVSVAIVAMVDHTVKNTTKNGIISNETLTTSLVCNYEEDTKDLNSTITGKGDTVSSPILPKHKK